MRTWRYNGDFAIGISKRHFVFGDMEMHYFFFLKIQKMMEIWLLRFILSKVYIIRIVSYIFITGFNSFTEINFYQYLHSQSIGTYITDGFMDGNSPWETNLIGNLWYVSESVNNKYTDRFTNGKARQKNYLLHSINKFNV